MDWTDAWLFPLASALLGGLGLLLLCRGLFGRHFVARNTRACPRCRYDMHATEGHACPECGHVARHEGEHYAGRRRWLPAALGAAIALGGIGIGAGPAVRASGWRSVLPDAVQAGMWDGSDAVLHDRLAERFWNGRLSPNAVRRLRDRVRGVLVDPASMPAQLARGVEFLAPTVATDLFDESDRMALIQEGRAVSVAAAIRRSIRLGAPQDEPMRAWRREQLNGSDFTLRFAVLSWMMIAPADDADRRAVRGRFASGGLNATWRFSEDFEGLEPLFRSALLELLEDEDERVRFHALESARVSGRRLGIVSGPLTERLQVIARDTDARGWDLALEMLSYVPFDAGPWLASWLSSERDPEVVHAMLTHASRRRDVSNELIGPLAVVANDEARPVGLRLEAARTHGRLIRMPGVTVKAPDDDVSSAYAGLVAGLLRDDPMAESLAREVIGTYPSASAVIAVARSVPEGVRGRAGIEAWIASHPALERSIARWTLADGPAAERFRAGLRRAVLGPSASPSMTHEGLEYMSWWFSTP